MTFTTTAVQAPCSHPMLLAFSGPAFTFGLEWIGMVLLNFQRRTLFGYALIFASFAHLRFIQTLTGRGDELLLAESWFGVSSQLIVAAAVFLLGLPPVVAAFRAQNRSTAFLATYAAPLPLLLTLLLTNRWLYGETGDQVRNPCVVGVPIVVLATQVIAAAVLTQLAWRARPSRA